MEIITEDDITKCAYHDHSYAAVSGVSDAIFSTFICLCMTCMMTSQVLLCLSFCTFKFWQSHWSEPYHKYITGPRF